jgi:uncharacterized membrane protein
MAHTNSGNAGSTAGAEATRGKGPAGLRILGPTLWLMLVLALVSIGLSVWGADAVPENARVAVQWSGEGVTSTVSKTLGLVLVPAIQIAFLLLGVLIPSISPRGGHLLQSRRAYRTVWPSVMAVLTLAHGLSMVAAAGYQVPVERIILTATALLLAVVGNVLGKVRSNYFLGVRTPWTLSSEYSWRKTHRLTGLLMTAVGLVSFVIGLFAPLPLLGGVLVGGALLVAAIGIGYSYIAWRADKEKNR